MGKQFFYLVATSINTTISLVDIAEIIVAVAAVGALVFSFFSWRQSKQALIAQSVSANRINWIGTVRNLIHTFLCEYNKEIINTKKLIDIYTEIALYCNPKHETYKNLIESLEKCISSGSFCKESYLQVLWEGQCVLDAAWMRLKQESGISSSTEISVKHFVEEYTCNENNKKWQASLNLPDKQNSSK